MYNLQPVLHSLQPLLQSLQAPFNHSPGTFCRAGIPLGSGWARHCEGCAAQSGEAHPGGWLRLLLPPLLFLLLLLLLPLQGRLQRLQGARQGPAGVAAGPRWLQGRPLHLQLTTPLLPL